MYHNKESDAKNMNQQHFSKPEPHVSKNVLVSKALKNPRWGSRII
jgi:hypothetical protein